MRYRVNEFLRDFSWALARYRKMEGSRRGFGRFMQNPARWYHELLISLVRKHAGHNWGWVRKDPLFTRLLYEMLIWWGMNQRAAKLVPYSAFRGRVLRLVASREFRRLSSKSIRQVRDTARWRKDLRALWDLLERPCRIMESNSIFVGSSKLLHHLLPDLVPPMDRTYTLDFLGGLDPSDPQSAPFALRGALKLRPDFDTFCRAMFFYGYVARRVRKLRRRVDIGPTSGSVTKIIDNAVIAWWQ